MPQATSRGCRIRLLWRSRNVPARPVDRPRIAQLEPSRGCVTPSLREPRPARRYRYAQSGRPSLPVGASSNTWPCWIKRAASPLSLYVCRPVRLVRARDRATSNFLSMPTRVLPTPKRTVFRETPIAPATAASRNGVPGASSPRRIRSRRATASYSTELDRMMCTDRSSGGVTEVALARRVAGSG